MYKGKPTLLPGRHIPSYSTPAFTLLHFTLQQGERNSGHCNSCCSCLLYPIGYLTNALAQVASLIVCTLRLQSWAKTGNSLTTEINTWLDGLARTFDILRRDGEAKMCVLGIVESSEHMMVSISSRVSDPIGAIRRTSLRLRYVCLLQH